MILMTVFLFILNQIFIFWDAGNIYFLPTKWRLYLNYIQKKYFLYTFSI